MPYRELVKAVGLSQGETHNAVRRLIKSRLLRGEDRAVNVGALLEFLSGGVQYVFPAEPGPETRGIPTAHTAWPLRGHMEAADFVVWPSAKGPVRGASLEPLYPGAAATHLHNPPLYELLVLVDALRIGRARERKRAKEVLHERLAERKARAWETE